MKVLVAPCAVELHQPIEKYRTFTRVEAPSCNLTKFEPFKFEILKNDKFEPKFETQNDFNIKSDKYQSCSTHEYLQLLFWSFLHLTIF